MKGYLKGYKVFTVYNNELYSFSLGFWIHGLLINDYKKINMSFIKNNLIHYKRQQEIKGKPWIALFDDKICAQSYLDMWAIDLDHHSGDIKFCLTLLECYYKKFKSKAIKLAQVGFMEFREFYDRKEILNCKKVLPTYSNPFPYGFPEGTIFASKIFIPKKES